EIALDVREIRAVRKTRADQRLLQRRALADANAAPVELRALAAARREDLLPQRIVDDAVLELAVARNADRDRELRKAVQIVRRAVEWIDDPLILVVARGAALLGEDCVIGIVIADDLDDRGFGGLVDLRDELVAAFLDDFERLELVHVANHDLSGAPRRSNCDVDHAVHWARSVE